MTKTRACIFFVLLFIFSDAFSNDIDKALDAYNKGDEKTALTLLTPLAKSGSARAQFELGNIYSRGKSETDTVSFGKAIYWLQQAAKQRDLRAQYNLAILYDKGIYDKGVLVNDSERAVYWYQQAADDGLANAQETLGIKYLKGEGVQKDVTKAISLFNKAADQGYAEAQFKLGVLYGQGKDVAWDANKSIFWFKKAAEQGDARSQHSLGHYYLMQPNNSKAEYWTRKAAEQGFPLAICNLALIYAEGYGVHKNLARARQWAEKGHALGQSQCTNILNRHNW